jgi:hypothetical protein
MTETFSCFEQTLIELFTMAERVVVALQQQRHFNERKDTIVDAPAPSAAAATNDKDSTDPNIPTEEESVHPLPSKKIPDHTDTMTPNTEKTKHHTDKTHDTDKMTLDTNEVSETDTLISHSSKFLHTDKIPHTDKITPTQDSIHLIEWYRYKTMKQEWQKTSNKENSTTQTYRMHNKPKHRKQRPRIKYPHETKENE